MKKLWELDITSNCCLLEMQLLISDCVFSPFLLCCRDVLWCLPTCLCSATHDTIQLLEMKCREHWDTLATTRSGVCKYVLVSWEFGVIFRNVDINVVCLAWLLYFSMPVTTCCCYDLWATHFAVLYTHSVITPPGIWLCMELIIGGDYTPEITTGRLPYHQINNVGKKLLLNRSLFCFRNFLVCW